MMYISFLNNGEQYKAITTITHHALTAAVDVLEQQGIKHDPYSFVEILSYYTVDTDSAEYKLYA